jgi:hypothetical protein
MDRKEEISPLPIALLAIGVIATVFWVLGLVWGVVDLIGFN